MIRGVKNGVPGLEILEGAEVLKREPNLNPNIVAALYAPTAGISRTLGICNKDA